MEDYLNYVIKYEDKVIEFSRLSAEIYIRYL